MMQEPEPEIQAHHEEAHDDGELEAPSANVTELEKEGSVM